MRTKYLRSRKRIELIVTYRCNRRCYNCEAMVRQAPSNEIMEINQIQKFVDESIQKQYKWDNIRVLGGEPTLHPNIEKIIEILENYRKNYNKNMVITIVTNGYGKAVNKKLDILKNKFKVTIENSNKKTDVQTGFWPVNQAPIDILEYENMDFSKGCWIPTVCGMALDMYGFYPCTAAAAFARVAGIDLGRKKLPEKEDSLEEIFTVFCRLCGHYYNLINDVFDEEVADCNNAEKLEKVIRSYQQNDCGKNKIDSEVISKTWEKIIENYNCKIPHLIRY